MDDVFLVLRQVTATYTQSQLFQPVNALGFVGLFFESIHAMYAIDSLHSINQTTQMIQVRNEQDDMPFEHAIIRGNGDGTDVRFQVL